MIDSTPGKQDDGPVYDVVDEERAPLAGHGEDGELTIQLALPILLIADFAPEQ